LLQKQKQQALRNSGALYGSTTKRFDGKEEKVCRWQTGSTDMQDAGVPISTGDADEDARIQAMFAQNADQWEQMQEDMSLYVALLLLTTKLTYSQSRGSGGNRGRGRPPGVGAGAGGRGGGAAGVGGRFDYSMPTDKEPPTGYICYRCGQKGISLAYTQLQKANE
jgi:protein MPE1